MAVHCGVCGERLYDATENWGSFPVNADFRGWDESRIKDTCRDCSTVLTKAVAEAANVILAAHRPRVEALRAEVAAAQERQAQYERERAAFDRDWASRHPATGTP
jgi:hypothetical protein